MAVTSTDIVNVPISKNSIHWAIFTALKKFPYTFQGTRSRPPLIVLDNLFRGDLAKSALIELLSKQGVSISNEYDQVRTDNFKYPNNTGYHFIANKSKIEVNSSAFPSGYGHAQALNLDIKVTAGDNGRILTSPLSLPFDITVQLYFDLASPLITTQFTNEIITEIANSISSPEDEQIQEIIQVLDLYNRYQNVLLGYGWANRSDIEQIRLNNQKHNRAQAWSYPRNTREYWYCKIRDTNPFSELHLYV